MILMIYTSFSTFVKLDHDILSKNYVVKKYSYDNKKSIISHFKNQFKIFFWLLAKINECDAVYIWFADYHSFFPIFFCNVFRKKSFLILGGYDVTYLPALNYGSQNNRIRKFSTIFSIKNASVILPVSRYVLENAKVMVPTANFNVLYNGFNSQIFFDNNNEKENLIITVGIINSEQRIKLKGIDLFVEAAKNLPMFKFVVIGISNEMQQYFNNIPENLIFIDKVIHEELVSYYQKAKVYCQFSIVESFGLAVVEAMACGCIGVVSNNGALAEVIKNYGVIINNSSIDEVKNAINYAVSHSKQLKNKSSQFVLDNYNIKIREEKLLSIINSYIKI